MARIPQRGDYTGAQVELAKTAAERRSAIGTARDPDPDPVDGDGIFDARTGLLEGTGEAGEVPRVTRRDRGDDAPLVDLAPGGEVFRIIRVSVPIEQLTFGVGTSYDFLPGRRYRVSADLAAWLDDRGVLL